MPGNNNSRTILVVDDDTAIREALRDTLEDEGYHVALASSGLDALAYLGAHSAPALILLDWNMAPMNAPQFMEEFCKAPAFSSIPVVLVTADARADEKTRTNRYEGFISKPVKLDALFAFASRYAAPVG